MKPVPRNLISLHLTFPHCKQTEEKVGSVGDNVREWMLNTSIGRVDATALGEKTGNNYPQKKEFSKCVGNNAGSFQIHIALGPEK